MCTDPERLFGHGEIVQPDADRDRRTAHHQCWFHSDRQGERPCTLGRQADVEPLVDDSTDRAQDIDAVQHEPRQREEERRACGGRGRITAVLSTRPPVAASKSSDQRSETLERAYAAVPPSALAPPGSIRRPLARFSNPEKSRCGESEPSRPVGRSLSPDRRFSGRASAFIYWHDSELLMTPANRVVNSQWPRRRRGYGRENNARGIAAACAAFPASLTCK